MRVRKCICPSSESSRLKNYGLSIVPSSLCQTMGVPILTIILRTNLCANALKIYHMIQEYGFVSLLEFFLSLIFFRIFFSLKINEDLISVNNCIKGESTT